MSKNLRLHTLPDDGALRRRDRAPGDAAMSALDARVPGSPPTIAELEECLQLAAYVVVTHGEVYAPLFERIERELEMARKQYSDPAARAAALLKHCDVDHLLGLGVEPVERSGPEDSPPARSRSVNRSAGRDRGRARIKSKLPFGITPRVLTREQAAEYCGYESLEAFQRWVREGIVPGPIPGTNRFDRHAIDRALDRRSGLLDSEDQSFEERMAAYEDRTGRHPA
jgi:hypothetical protein